MMREHATRCLVSSRLVVWCLLSRLVLSFRVSSRLVASRLVLSGLIWSGLVLLLGVSACWLYGCLALWPR
eukprot:2456379-Rhodomonas_salina.1